MGVPTKAKEPPKKRVRRTPEEARALILAAADTVFRDHLPDTVGLKEIARAAGVSHALVTHYFGTYEGLVEAALERRFKILRESLVGKLLVVLESQGGLGEMLLTYRRAIAEQALEPATMRLAMWALLSGRIAQDDFFSHRMQGLRFLADALEARANVPREDLEFVIVASFAMTVLWSVGGNAVVGALGRKRAKGADAEFETRTTAMLDAYLEHVRRDRSTR